MTRSYLSLAIFQFLTGFANARIFSWECFDGSTAIDVQVGDHMYVDCANDVYIHPTMDCSMDGAILVGSGTYSYAQWYDFSSTDAGTKMFFTCDDGDSGDCFAGEL